MRQVPVTEWPLSECLFDGAASGPSHASGVDMDGRAETGRGRDSRAEALAERTTYRELFLCALRRHRILVIGLYRRLERQQQQDVRPGPGPGPGTSARRYVVTFPPPNLLLRSTDLVNRTLNFTRMYCTVLCYSVIRFVLYIVELALRRPSACSR